MLHVIRFGTSHYCRKIVKPEDVGLSSENVQQFELTQSYAWLYWMPMFPLKASWHARGHDNRLYEVDESVLPRFNRIHSAWYTMLLAFLGPILILSFWGMYEASQVYKQQQQVVYDDEMVKKDYDEKVALITHPAIDDYYAFGEVDRSVHATVIAYNDTAVKLALIWVNPNRPAEEQVIAKLHSTKNIATDWISKRTLIAMGGGKAKEIPSLDTGAYYINKIMRLEAPILVPEGTSDKGGVFTVTLRNMGKNLVITALTGASTEIPILKLWRYRGFYYFSMPAGKGEPFTFTLTCEDEKGKSFGYLISGKKDLDAEIKIIRQ